MVLKIFHASSCPIISSPADLRSFHLDRLPVTNVSALQREEQKRRKLAEQAAKQERKKGGVIASSSQGRQYENDLGEYAAASSSQGIGLGPTLQDIIGGSERFNPRNAEQLVEEFGVKESDLVSIPNSVGVSVLMLNRLPCRKLLNRIHS